MKNQAKQFLLFLASKIYLLGLLMILLACSSRGGGELEYSSAKPGISIEIIDTIRIDYLGNFTVHDIDPIGEHVLFMEHRESDATIYIADFSGEVLFEHYKSRDTPDTYGKLLTTLKFLDGEKFFAYGSQGLLTYEFDGTLVSLIKPDDYSLPYGLAWGMGISLIPYNTKLLFAGQNNMPRDYSEPEFYEEVQFLTWLDPATGEIERFNNLPDTSLFRSGKFYHTAATRPNAELVGNSIYMTYGIEPAIYEFSADPPYELRSSFTIDLPEYHYFEGASKYVNDVHLYGNGITSGRISHILKAGEYWLVNYFPGYNATDRNRTFESMASEERQQFYQEMRDKYKSKTIALDSEGKQVPLQFDEILQRRNITCRNGRYFMVAPSNPDIEQEFFEIYELAIHTNK
ncbi:hypothetical protein SAMN04489724_1863 [Algoriphagus locisalis]|uniref:6-bladed beta-propeller n=1 Tax=Algoriphagus locisalis TaxID=305507 RepID=A0A1I7AD04_9BACT|nr:hypothetical protein [Algoriphagus locisalis]SFT72764.1 hypothetical protein SAMN04489724_1863 [Algoriphagus locisalis]